MFVIAGNTYAPTRIMEDYNGKPIKEAGLSCPVGIVGFTEIPKAGATFHTTSSKKEAEVIVNEVENNEPETKKHTSDLPVVPIMIKADVLGSLDAIKHELDKFESDRISIRVIGATVGDVSASDVQDVSATENSIIVGFNVKVERAATDLAERLGVEIDTFDIIYELSDWLNTALKNRTPKREEKVMTGRAKILKHFSTQKNTHVLGGRVEEGELKANQVVRILRRDIEVGTGTLKNVQQQKSDTQKVSDGEFGMQIDSKVELAPGDYIEAFDIVIT
jgi:translation initiation factor IF-2